MAFVEPVDLSGYGVALAPLALAHEAGLRAAAADGALWNLRVTSVPEPENTRQYIEDALAMHAAGNRFAFCGTGQAGRNRDWLQQLPRHITGRETGRNRLHLVRQKQAAQPRQHRLQIADDDPCV